jgi:hypothetical protein
VEKSLWLAAWWLGTMSSNPFQQQRVVQTRRERNWRQCAIEDVTVTFLAQQTTLTPQAQKTGTSFAGSIRVPMLRLIG